MAMEFAKGNEDNSLTISWLGEPAQNMPGAPPSVSICCLRCYLLKPLKNLFSMFCLLNI